MEISDILKSVDNDILTEETLASIKETFEQKVDEKVQIAVESALLEQDEAHAQKLKQIVQMIDEDHTQKLSDVVDQLNETYKARLEEIVEKYETELGIQAKEHIDMLTDSLDQFLERYLDEAIPSDLVKEAAENKYATRILKEAKKVLAVDAAAAKNEISEAIRDGHETILALEQTIKRKDAELDKVKAARFLESKLKAYPAAKANFIKKRLEGKPYSFIKEQFSYVESLYVENTSSDFLSSSPKPSVDRQNSGVIVESTDSPKEQIGEDANPLIDFYINSFNRE